MLIVIAGVLCPQGVGRGDFEIDIGDYFPGILFFLDLVEKSAEPLRD